MAHPVIEFLVSVAVIVIANAALVVALRRNPGVAAFEKSNQQTYQRSEQSITACLLIVASCLALVAVGVRCTAYLALEKRPSGNAIFVLNSASLIIFGIGTSAPKLVALLRARKLATTKHDRLSVALGLTLAATATTFSITAGVLIAIPALTKAVLVKIALYFALSLVLATLVIVRVSECLVGLGQFGYWRTSVLSAFDAKITACCVFALAVSGLDGTFFALTNAGTVWGALSLAWETDAQDAVKRVRSLRVRASAESFGSAVPRVEPFKLEEGDSMGPMFEKRTSTILTLSVLPLVVKSNPELIGFPVSIHSGDDPFDIEDSQKGVDVSLSEISQADEGMDQVSSSLTPIPALEKVVRQSVASKHKVNWHENKGTRASSVSNRMSESSRYSEESTFFEPNPANLPPPIYLARHKRLTRTNQCMTPPN